MGEDITGRSFIRKIEEWEREREGESAILKHFLTSSTTCTLTESSVFCQLRIFHWVLSHRTMQSVKDVCFLTFLSYFYLCHVRRLYLYKCMHHVQGLKLSVFGGVLKKKNILKYLFLFFILEQLLQKTFHLKKLIKCVYTHTTLGICLFCLFVRNGGYT